MKNKKHILEFTYFFKFMLTLPALQIEEYVIIYIHRCCLCVCVLVTQSRPTLCNPMDCSPPGSSVHGILQARILEWGCHASTRESSPSTQGLNPGLLHCRWILYHLSHTETHSFTHLFTRVHIDTTAHRHAQIDFHTFTRRGT